MTDNKYKYGNESVDKWFAWKGLTPPERTPHLTEDELKHAFEENLKDHVCDWLQKGNAIECDASPNYTHGKVIGVRERLAGTDEKGSPMLVPIGPIYRSDL